eukprot:NODE_1946_length_1347_cov_29.167180_g1763_i0.p1 GENE.NODE_1946_length_1347_cov_29.167180_g1763_i0~~NODE_1946_length_1347_cov_29.167180_g1763_i0.p1  ORF type:complete len:288 (-),score=21.47 NODE_1946_length_1347_cov_29.167180_g1763_i0:393-1256(-)
MKKCSLSVESFEDTAAAQQFECSVCLGVPLIPQVVGQCQHIFCTECLDAYAAHSKPYRKNDACPNCRRRPILRQRLDDPNHQVWAALMVRCSLCGASVTLCSYASHLHQCFDRAVYSTEYWPLPSQGMGCWTVQEFAYCSGVFPDDLCESVLTGIARVWNRLWDPLRSVECKGRAWHAARHSFVVLTCRLSEPSADSVDMLWAVAGFLPESVLVYSDLLRSDSRVSNQTVHKRAFKLAVPVPLTQIPTARGRYTALCGCSCKRHARDVMLTLLGKVPADVEADLLAL